MKISINTISVTPYKFGIKTFLVNLIQAFLKVDSANEYVLLCSSFNRGLFQHLSQYSNLVLEEIDCFNNSSFRRIIYDQFYIQKYLKKHVPAIHLTPSNIASLVAPSGIKQVVLLQALLSVRYIRQEAVKQRVPFHIDLLHKIYYDCMMPLSLKKADSIIAMSEYIRNKIVEEFPRYAQKIKSIHEGVNLKDFQETLPPEVPTDESRTSRPYILFVSSLFPYKRADLLVEAFACLKKSARIQKDYSLKIVGKDPDGKQVPALKHICIRHGVESSVEFVGSVPYSLLPRIYRKATLFVYPSCMESFGLPILEAMSSGIPVICSNRMCLPEIAGDAALLVDPDNIDSLARAIEKLVHDEGLRHALRNRGYKRCQSFTWENAAKSYLEEFFSILS